MVDRVRRLGGRLQQPGSWTLGSLVLIAGNAASRLLGFFRELAMAALFGTSVTTDDWLMASVLPNLLFNTVNAALANVIVPVMAGSTSPDDDARYLRELTGLVGAGALFLTLVGEVFAPELVRLLAPGFTPPEVAQTVMLTRIMLPTIIFWAGSGIATGALQARAIYAPTSGAPVVVNLVRIATILTLGRIFGITGVAVGFVLAVASQWAYLMPSLLRQGFSLAPAWTWSNPRTRESLRLTAPFLFMSTTGALGVLVDRILASTLPVGSIAALNYAYLLSQLPLGTLVNSVTLPGFTQLAANWNRQAVAAYRHALRTALELALLVAVPSTVFLGVAAVPLVALIYQRGAFNTHSTIITASVLGDWAVGLPAAAASLALSRALFSLRRPRPMVAISVGTVAVNIAADLALIHPLGASGLALGTSLAAWTAAVLNWMYLARRHMVPTEVLRRRFLVRYVGATLVLLAVMHIVGPALVHVARPHHLLREAVALVLVGGVTGVVWLGALAGLRRVLEGPGHGVRPFA